MLEWNYIGKQLVYIYIYASRVSNSKLSPGTLLCIDGSQHIVRGWVPKGQNIKAEGTEISWCSMQLRVNELSPDLDWIFIIYISTHLKKAIYNYKQCFKNTQKAQIYHRTASVHMFFYKQRGWGASQGPFEIWSRSASVMDPDWGLIGISDGASRELIFPCVRQTNK